MASELKQTRHRQRPSYETSTEHGPGAEMGATRLTTAQLQGRLWRRWSAPSAPVQRRRRLDMCLALATSASGRSLCVATGALPCPGNDAPFLRLPPSGSSPASETRSHCNAVLTDGPTALLQVEIARSVAIRFGVPAAPCGSSRWRRRARDRGVGRRRRWSRSGYPESRYRAAGLRGRVTTGLLPAI